MRSLRTLPSLRTLSRSLAAASLAGLTGLAVAAVPAGPAHAATTTTDPARAGAGWLARQLVDGDHYLFEGSTFADYGSTADGVVALAAAGVGRDAAGKATDFLAAHVADYADTAGQFGGPLAGSYAKLALAAAAEGRDPHKFGGVDLVAGITSLEDANGMYKQGGFETITSQSLAILALSRAKATVDGKAVTFLAGAQCAGGGFPSAFPAAGATCTPDPDSTAIAAEALWAAGRTADAGKVLDWLVGTRKADGGYEANGVENANSTSLAASALTLAGRDDGAELGWLRANQVGCAGADADRGASQYNGKAQVRATVEAVLALSGKTVLNADGTAASADVPALDCAGSPAPTTSSEPAAAGGGELPRTGLPAGLLAGTGVAFLLAGGVALYSTRRRARRS
ncbi:MAG: hypothetical protein ACJ73S_01190 [Mycobacteriales bacterium]